MSEGFAAKPPAQPFPWIDTVTGAAAVDAAGRAGVFDGSGADLPELLTGVLEGLGVLTADGRMTPEFAAAWAGQGADIRARAAFYCRAAADVAEGLAELAGDLPAFMARSRTFRFFRYDTALGTDPEALAATAEWVAYLEALSRHEAPILAPRLPFGPGDRVLEVGGNTGVMAEALVARGAEVTVLDLPAVCALGRERRPGVRFVAGDARAPGVIEGFRSETSHVLFKSVLHDWPKEDALGLIESAVNTTKTGGRVVVCERGRPGLAQLADGSSQGLANLVFAPFYRGPDLYAEAMAGQGLEVTVDRVEIDMPFVIVTGTRP